MAASSNCMAKTSRIGVVVDKRYRIVGLLGRGAMATVYRAEHVVLRRPVALKVVHTMLAQGRVRQRFEREAFAAARARHPNCVAVYDHGALQDGSHYLVMELLDGVTLAERLAEEKQLDAARALHIARHVLRGLDCAHDNGVIHRDVKPENIHLTDHAGDIDYARLLDFGLAKLVNEAFTVVGARSITELGISLGTPMYIAPEQALGKDVDGRADVYAMGVVLFEMLTGRPPFIGKDSLDVVRQHIKADLPFFAEVASHVDIPVEVEYLVRRALAKSPIHRFGSAREFLDAIAVLLPEDGYLAPTHTYTPKAPPRLITPGTTSASDAPQSFGETCQITEVEMTEEEYRAYLARCDRSEW